jgi:hypothetical protein
MVDIENVSDDSNERKSENEQEDQRKSDNEEVEPKSDNTGDTKSDSNTVPDSTVPDSTECAPPSTADLSSGLGTARTLSSEQPLMTGTLDVVDVVDLSKDSKEAQTEEAEKAKAAEEATKPSLGHRVLTNMSGSIVRLHLTDGRILVGDLWGLDGSGSFLLGNYRKITELRTDPVRNRFFIF